MKPKEAAVRVLITGAAGTSGTAVTPRLANAGHECGLLDVRELDTELETVRGDHSWLRRGLPTRLAIILWPHEPSA